MKETFMLLWFFISKTPVGLMLLIATLCVTLRVLIIHHVNNKRAKKDADYLAKKIAEEIKNS